MPEHRSSFGGEDAKLLETIETLFREKPFSPPNAAEVANQTGIPAAKVAKLLGLLREHGRLVQVDAAGMLFHSDAVARAREILAEHFRKEGRLESVQFKYLLDTTRKYALPMLDYMDRIGATPPRRQHAISEESANVPLSFERVLGRGRLHRLCDRSVYHGGSRVGEAAASLAAIRRAFRESLTPGYLHT